jgi:hypothetical protein
MAMRPDGFERVAIRLLHEADFDSVNVTGKSGDGGIDGLGVYRLGPASFRPSSSASATQAASDLAQSETSAVPWQAAATKAC